MSITATLLLAFINAGMALSFLFVFTIRHQNSSLTTHSGVLFTGMFAWATFYAVLYLYFPGYLALGVIGDIIKNASVVFFVYRLSQNKINHPPGLQLAITLSLIAMPASLLSTLDAEWMVTIYSMAGVVLCVVILLLCERAYHVCTGTDGNKELHLIFGIAIITGLEFFTYCDTIFSTKFKIEHIQWRMTAVLFALPLIYRGINNLRRTPLKLSLSRPLAFHGSIMVIVGSYLLAVSLLTTLSSYFSYQWDHTSKTILFGGLLFPIAYLFLSNRIRSEIRVWVNKHLFAGQFDYRRTWLELLDTLDPTLNGKDAVKCGLNAILNVLDHTRGAFFLYNQNKHVVTEMGAVNLSLSEESESELENYLKQMGQSNTSWIIDVNELKESPSAYTMLHSQSSHLVDDGVLWVIPVTKNNQIVGAMLIGKEDYAHWELSWETRDFLNALSQHLHRYYEAQMSQQKLNESAQLLAFSQMTAFVTHDMKNVYAQLSMITKNAKDHRDNPKFVDDVFDDLEGMERRMKKMLDQLTSKKRNDSDRKSQKVHVMPIIESIVSDPTSTKLNITPKINGEIGDDVFFYGDEERFNNVIRHIIENAQQAAAEKDMPWVSVDCNCTKKHVIITIEDNGVGMDEKFIKERLFKPFDTTKGNSGMGLGVYDAKVFSEDHDGTLNVDSEVNKGTKISLTIPRSGI